MNKCFFILLILVSFNSTSQNNSGYIEYTSILNKSYSETFIENLNNNKEVPVHIKAEVIEMYKNAQPELYELVFKDNESFFRHIRVLNVDNSYNMGSKAGTSSFYTGYNKIVEYNILGFVLKEKLDWTITKETKNIGGFNCFKAIAIEELMSRKGYIKEKEIIAWFTTEIAASFGPQSYSGLPGLVLEVTRDDYSIVATKIDLNPTKEIKIKRPKESRIITQEEANDFIKARAEGN